MKNKRKADIFFFNIFLFSQLIVSVLLVSNFYVFTVDDIFNALAKLLSNFFI